MWYVKFRSPCPFITWKHVLLTGSFRPSGGPNEQNCCTHDQKRVVAWTEGKRVIGSDTQVFLCDPSAYFDLDWFITTIADLPLKQFNYLVLWKPNLAWNPQYNTNGGLLITHYRDWVVNERAKLQSARYLAKHSIAARWQISDAAASVVQWYGRNTLALCRRKPNAMAEKSCVQHSRKMIVLWNYVKSSTLFIEFCPFRSPQTTALCVSEKFCDVLKRKT